MRPIFFIWSFFMLWCFTLPLAAQDEKDFVLKKKISLHVKDQPLGNVLDETSGQAGIYFSYIRKKPKGFNVRPLDLDYRVTYRNNNDRWSLSAAQTSVRFRVRSRNDKINSVFHSISDLLVTNMEKTGLRRFEKDETFLPTDIFTEMIIDYDK